MRTLSIALSVLLVPSTALATPSFDVVAEGVLGADLAELPEGAGSPALAFDQATGQLHLFFETQVAAAGCAEAWSIGHATSTDGVGWSFDSIVAGPVAGTPHECGARHPAVVIDDDGTQYMFFNVVDTVSDDQVAVTRIANGRRTTQIIPELEGLHEPSVANWDGEWVLLGVRSDSADQAIVTARSADGRAWTLDVDDAIPMGATLWATDGHLSPSLLCLDGPAWEWELYYGGYSPTESGWTWAVSDDANTWYVSAALDLWTPEPAWLSWDVLRFGAEQVLVYEDLDDNGVPRIGLAATDPAWTPVAPSGRRCDNPLTP